jgi:retron-type reverse transcriptase
MKRTGNLMTAVLHPDNFRLAAWKAARGKRGNQNVLIFFDDLENNLSHLRQQVADGNYAFGNYHTFEIFEPKRRLIAAPPFHDQVIHHALMNLCDPTFERKKIFDSYASRRGKGVFACLDRATAFHRNQTYYLKLDVKDFFGSIHHQTLKDQLAKLFKEDHLLLLFSEIIDSFCHQPERGLPIGNLTSQYFANHYLCSLDHHIKEIMKVKAYVRYMDDMVLWASDKASLLLWERQIRAYVNANLKQELKPIQLQATKRGLPFLGFRLFPTHRLLTQQSKRRFFNKASRLIFAESTQTMETKEAARRLRSLIAFTEHADTKALRTEFLRRHKIHTP